MTVLPTLRDENDLKSLEEIIGRGLKVFRDVAEALFTIRDRRLYLVAGHASFDAYCRERWQFGRDRADRLIVAAQTAKLLPTGVADKFSERAVRELRPLVNDPEMLVAAAKLAADRAGGKPTSAQVARVVREVTGQRDRTDRESDSLSLAGPKPAEDPEARRVERARLAAHGLVEPLVAVVSLDQQADGKAAERIAFSLENRYGKDKARWLARGALDLMMRVEAEVGGLDELADPDAEGAAKA